MDEYEFEIDDEYDVDTEYENDIGLKIHLVGHKVRTARRDYECSKCHTKIPVNTKYMDFATRYMRTRFCVECGKSIANEE